MKTTDNTMSRSERNAIAHERDYYKEQYHSACNQRDALRAALRETLDALYNETHQPDAWKSDSPGIAGIKERAQAAIAAAESEGQ